jgi:hypothetical protein
MKDRNNYMEENIIKLIKRYEKKIEWLEKHKDSKYIDIAIETFEGVIYDLNDLLDGIEM